jgi:phosphoserine phosphatase RsbU/P
VPDFSFRPDDPVFPELGTYHSMAACPGAMRKAENWVFILDARPGNFDIAALEDLALRVLLTGSALENLRIADELRAAYQQLEKATEFIRSEVTRIAAIQKCLLPSPEPVVPGLDVSAWSETYDQAGGDIYDYTNGPGGRWACMVADASGHGASATVVAAILHTILHTFPQVRRSQTDSGDVSRVELTTVLTFANEQLAAKRIEKSFVTAFLAAWDPITRILSYACAAHNPPLLYRRGDRSMIELSDASGLPLGLFAQAAYKENAVQLSSGDVVVMFSDGIVEAESAAGEQFGIDRLRSVMMSAAAGSAREIVAAIHAAVREHEGGVRPNDDQTVFVLRVV